MAREKGCRNTVPLPDTFLSTALAHRGLHSQAEGYAENSVRAAERAVEKGYGIELDVQLSRDNEAMVFHDADLSRLTGQQGLVREETSDALTRLPLLNGGGDRIPLLQDFLGKVAGRTPVLIELKDQSGCFGPESDALAAAVSKAVATYAGPVAVMSFNPHSVAHLARLAPHIPRGLTTMRFRPGRSLGLSDARRLSAFAMFKDIGASFISHDRRSLNMSRVTELRADNVPILTWTITSARQEAEARKVAHNITFEQYLPAHPTSAA